MIASARWSRRILAAAVTRVLYHVNLGDVSIRHHWTGAPFRLHSFKHRTYWFHGRRREQGELARLQSLIQPGDWVFEVGGHIGYISQLLASLVGSHGRLVVFEPGANNLPYLKENLAGLPHVSLIEKAVCDRVGTAEFFLEDLSGQNNSLLADYESFRNNCQRLGQMATPSRRVQVACTTLDAEVAERSICPTLVKIDVEGAEQQVLAGMQHLLATHSVALMLEVTVDADAVFQLLSQHDYAIFSAAGQAVEQATNLRGNVFCLKRNDPRLQCFAP